MYLDIALAASNMYGSLTMIVFIMIWMYFCMDPSDRRGDQRVF